MQIRIGFAVVGIILLLLIAPAPVVWILILLLLLGAIAAGRYAFVAILDGISRSANDRDPPRREATDADQPPAVDSPPG